MANRESVIRRHIQEIKSVLGNARPPVAIDDPILQGLHRTKDYAGMVRVIRNHMRLKLRIRVGFAHHDDQGPRGAPAWVQIPNTMPYYGSRELDNFVITMFIRKSFLSRERYETIVTAIAHELSHVLLKCVGNKLWDNEEAVDVTAMFMGYRYFYFLANTDQYRIGYLSKQEVQLANALIAQMTSPVR